MESSEPTASSLIRPLSETDILVRGERIFYARRFHWMSVVPAVYQSFSVLLVVFVLFIGGGPVGGVFGGLLFFIALGGIISMIKTAKLSRNAFYLLVVGLVVGFFVLRIEGMALLAVFLAFQRFIVTIARWAFYERIFITTRRVIGSSGFLGSKIDTLPLSRATDISFSKTILGEVFGYATLRIETAGQDQALGTVPYLEDPDLFYELLILLSVGETGGVAR